MSDWSMQAPEDGLGELYGRIQDRLSHVLVSSPHESHREFFYPTPKSHLICAPEPNGRPHDAQDVKVTLAEIPFVRLHHRATRSGRLTSTRREAAALLERLYGFIGWHEPGRNRKQREKQIRKRRDAIARIRHRDNDASAGGGRSDLL